jgi:UDP-N-acetyl-D-glucosamine dehydrogenase
MEGSMDRFDVAIVGLGFTGLPVAVAAAEAGLRVAGVDSSARRVEDITAVAPGCGLTTVPEASVAGLITRGLLEVSQGHSPPAARTYVLCVPTPPGSDGGADLAPLLTAIDAVAERLRRDDLVLVQSTCPPGVVERVLASRLARVSGLAPGSGFGLAYSPVRIMPGTDLSDLRTLPRIVAGVTGQCRDRAMRFLQLFTSELVPVSCVLVAELTKIFENTFRLVNISLANELAALCREACVDPDEVLGAAETKPFGFLRHQPSTGAGGSCIPVAAAFFAAAARRHGVAAEVVEAAVALNRAMPARTIHLAKQILAANGLPQLENCRVLMVGVTYKPDVAHTGFSSAVRILEELRLDADVSYHDPYVPRLVLGDGTTLHSRPIEPDIADVVLLLTKHCRMDGAALDRCRAPVVDCTTGIPRLLATYPAKAG